MHRVIHKSLLPRLGGPSSSRKMWLPCWASCRGLAAACSSSRIREACSCQGLGFQLLSFANPQAFFEEAISLVCLFSEGFVNLLLFLEALSADPFVVPLLVPHFFLGQPVAGKSVGPREGLVWLQELALPCSSFRLFDFFEEAVFLPLCFSSKKRTRPLLAR